MAKKKQTEIVEVVAKCDMPIANTEIENMIFSLRGTQVMLDSDLAMRHFMASNVMVFQRLEVIEHHQLELSARQTDTEQKIEEVFKRLDNGNVQPSQGIFFDGQIFDAYTFVSDLIRSAKKRVVLFDNYVDDSVLTLLDKRNIGVDAQIYTRSISPQLSLDLQRHNAQYSPIAITEFQNAHDRFLCIDDTVYHIGASLKDLGKKWFAFGRMEIRTDALLQKTWFSKPKNDGK